MLFILIFLTSLVLQLFLPWWIIGIAAFTLAFFKGKGAGSSFFAGFSAIFILWAAMGVFKSLANNNLLANRVGQLLGLPDMSFNWMILLVITGITGGIAAGFAALAGFYCKSATSK